MDDTKLHMSSPGGCPSVNSLNKQRLREFLFSKSIAFAPSDPAVTLRLKAKEWERSNVRPAIVEVAERLGHKVVFVPVSYSDLQPLESIWNHIKARIGLGAPKNMTLSQLGEKLIEEVGLIEQAPAFIGKAIDDITPALLELADEDVAIFARSDDDLETEPDGEDGDDDVADGGGSDSATDEEGGEVDGSDGEFAV
jgi:hypothetical protein